MQNKPWRKAWFSQKAHDERQRYSEHVIIELSMWNQQVVTDMLASTAQDFMRRGMGEDLALMFAYTFHVIHGSAMH